MILVGIDKEIDTFSKFTFIKNIDELKNTPNNSLVIFDYKREELATYNLDTPLGVKISSLNDFIFLINTKADFAICEKKLAIEVQKCADNYLTDIKILVIIKDEDELLWVAKNEIDGAIYIV